MNSVSALTMPLAMCFSSQYTSYSSATTSALDHYYGFLALHTCGCLLFRPMPCASERFMVNPMRNWIKWGKAAAIRAAKTFAQTTVALLPASAMITDVDWKVVVGTAALAAVASLLTSLAGIPEEDL